MSTTFSISCKDEITVPAASKPFDVTIENFDRDFKEFFDDADKLQAFIQAQVDEKFTKVTANSRDRDHARAESPKVTVEGGNIACFNLTVKWCENNDESNMAPVSENWKVDMKTKEVVAEDDDSKKVVFQKEEATAATTSSTAKNEPTSSSSTKKQDAETKKEIKAAESKDEPPTAVAGADAPPSSPKTEKGEQCSSCSIQ